MVPSGKQIRVLIVEDNADHNTLIRQSFESAGSDFSVVIGESLAEAVELFDSSNPDVVISDLFLPDGQANALLKSEKIRNSVPTIMMTAFGDQQTAADTIKSGVADYVVKSEASLMALPRVARRVLREWNLIQERKISEQALQESEERYRILVENSPVPILVHTDDKFVFLNNAAVRALGGRSADDLIGRSIWDVVHPDYHDIGKGRVQRIYRKEAPADLLEIKYIRLDERVIDVEAMGSVVDYNGRPSAQVVFRDITERKAMERELLKARKLESIGLLAGGIAHDFNNLLTGVLGNISFARLEADSNDDIHTHLNEAEKAAERAKLLAQQLLTFSRGGEPVKEITSIEKLVKEVVASSLRGSDSVVRYSFPEDLRSVEVDCDQMSQVVQNIILNADQAMSEGGEVVVSAVNTSVKRGSSLPLTPGDYVKIAFSDQGTGISEEHLSCVFDPYFTTRETGSGLGLTAVYSIVRRHDGLVEVESEIGKGSTFRIYLPASDIAQRDVSVAKSGDLHGSGHILVMDDEGFIRDLSRRVLEKFGYDVDCAVDGREAISLYRKAAEKGKCYDAILLDLIVPGDLDGKETLRILREDNPRIKAIVCSGYSDDPVMADCGHYGFSAAVPKPFKPSELARAVHNLLHDA